MDIASASLLTEYKKALETVSGTIPGVGLAYICLDSTRKEILHIIRSLLRRNMQQRKLANILCSGYMIAAVRVIVLNCRQLQIVESSIDRFIHYGNNYIEHIKKHNNI